MEGKNCSQAVFAAFAPDLGLSEETALAVSVGLGGGVGRLREVCGAETHIPNDDELGEYESIELLLKETKYSLWTIDSLTLTVSSIVEPVSDNVPVRVVVPAL